MCKEKCAQSSFQLEICTAEPKLSAFDSNPGNLSSERYHFSVAAKKWKLKFRGDWKVVPPDVSDVIQNSKRIGFRRAFSSYKLEQIPVRLYPEISRCKYHDSALSNLKVSLFSRSKYPGTMFQRFQIWRCHDSVARNLRILFFESLVEPCSTVRE